jgi:hypothetical protein
MSLVKISGNASGTGTLTIAAPNTNTDYTLTLPQATGTLINTAPGTASNVLTSNGTDWVSQAAAGGGKLLQVVQSTITTQTIFSSSTYADATDFNASITPSSTSSKVLVFMNIAVFLDNFNTGSTNIGAKIVRGATDIYESLFAAGYALNIFVATPLIYLDSPASTSSVTYKLQVKASSAYNNSRINPSNLTYSSKSTITLMEIAA